MTTISCDMSEEPTIAVGLVENSESVALHLRGDFTDSTGRRLPPGEYQIECREGMLECSGAVSFDSQKLQFTPSEMGTDRFSLEATIGINFHWQQQEMQTFCGGLRFVPQPENCVTVINDVPLETYLISVICSEMSADSPPEFIKAHSIISRSWLLAQLESITNHQSTMQNEQIHDGEIIRWYDRQAHTEFDVCADDHCQRYQGVSRIRSPEVQKAILDTRGQVLAFNGQACDARFSKCCGGVTEDFRTAWSDRKIPYLVPVPDAPDNKMPSPSLTEEQAMRQFISNQPDAYCNCTDERILNKILVSYDKTTRDFFRWQVKLSAHQASKLIKDKLGIDLGRLVAMEPVERGLSGRLKRLHLKGETKSVVIGKELEIRRALSPSHLYSSAFVIDIEGTVEKPETFILNGAGWGHGVGLCQIGAAAMAEGGIGYKDILKHYYPGTVIERFYG